MKHQFQNKSQNILNLKTNQYKSHNITKIIFNQVQYQTVFRFKFKTKIIKNMDVNQIFFLGHNKYGQAGIGEQEHNKKYSQPKQIVFKTFIKQVSCGNHHSALLTIDGLIYTMGSNIHGTLGLANTGNINYAFKPTLVKDLKDIDQVVSGSYHMCAIKQGQLYTWGKGIDGQLGHGNMKNVFVPTKVQVLGNEVESVSCGLNHTLVVMSKNNNGMNGYSFGSGIYGQLGSGSNRSCNYPVNIKLQNIQAVSAGENHSLFISEGRVYGCGDNSCLQMGQLQDSLRNKKYILEPIRLNICDEQVSLIDCHNVSVALTSQGKSYAWGGACKIWPPVQIDETEIVNVKVSNEKLYYISGKNQLIQLSFTGPITPNQKRQLILSNRNVLDFDAGENHLFALGDIVAQTQDKMESSFLSLWAGEQLTSSKQNFSQKILNPKNSVIDKSPKQPINKQMSDLYFTMHLRSGKSEEQSKSKGQNSQIRETSFESAHQSAQGSIMQDSNQTFKTFQNISSSIQMQSRHPLEINQSETKNYYGDHLIVEPQNAQQENQSYLKPFTVKSKALERQSRNPSQTKLQKLMDEMESKTIHLKKNYAPTNMGQKYQKSLIKTPSSYIKKQPQRFVVESQQGKDCKRVVQDPKISHFDFNLQVETTLTQPDHKNSPNNFHQQKQKLKQKIRSKSIICYEDKQNISKKEKQINEVLKDINLNQMKKEQSNIETIFMQLLKKQQKQKTSNQISTKNIYLVKDPHQRSQQRINRLSSSCIQPKLTQSSTQRTEIQQHYNDEMPKLVPMNKSPYQENKMAVSKISDHSNLSGRRTFQRNSDLREISRSNRQLRFELRERDFKVSQLQEELSKKEIQVQMLFKQLQYFKNRTPVCQECGAQVNVQDSISSF